MTKIRDSLPWMLGCVVLLTTGCNQGDRDTTSVSGSVQYANKPITVGEIRFVPTLGTKSSTVGGQIHDGQFEIAAGQGLAVGEYRVEVLGYRPRNGSTGPVDLMDPEADYVQYVPVKHNKNSQEIVAVQSTDSPLALDFALPK
ncbi:hypothetical protein [Aeoliella sp.]|uniref:hypothetical protein n=1 Tax=Aeoliella sp. TaxID=2795800 RepID=UPI003CCBE8CF